MVSGNKWQLARELSRRPLVGESWRDVAAAGRRVAQPQVWHLMNLAADGSSAGWAVLWQKSAHHESEAVLRQYLIRKHYSASPLEILKGSCRCAGLTWCSLTYAGESIF